MQPGEMTKETDQMPEMFNASEAILLDGKPLLLVTRAGVSDWIENGIPYTYRYDVVRDPVDGQMKYRCLYEKNYEDVPFVLVNDPENGDVQVVLFDEMPDHTTVFSK
jgi:hypothetical protein